MKFKKIKSTYFASNNAISLSPNDPVRINFALGEPPSDPIIESEDNVLLRVDAKLEILFGKGLINLCEYSQFRFCEVIWFGRGRDKLR